MLPKILHSLFSNFYSLCARTSRFILKVSRISPLLKSYFSKMKGWIKEESLFCKWFLPGLVHYFCFYFLFLKYSSWCARTFNVDFVLQKAVLKLECTVWNYFWRESYKFNLKSNDYSKLYFYLLLSFCCCMFCNYISNDFCVCTRKLIE